MKQLLKILTITLCVTANLSEVFASASTPDLLIYKGDTLSFFANPLERYAEIDSIRFKLFGDIKTATTWSCIRGYIAEWKIIDNELYLNNIYSCTNRTVKANLKQLFKNQYRNRKVKAKWFTGNVLAPNGKMLFSFNSAYDYYYDKEIEFEIKNGNVVDTKKHNYSLAKVSSFRVEEKKLIKFIYSNINWKNVPKIEGKGVRVTIRFSANEKGEIDSVNVMRIKNENLILEKEAIRVIKLIPEWDVLYSRGKHIRIPWTFPIIFNEENREKYRLIANESPSP